MNASPFNEDKNFGADSGDRIRWKVLPELRPYTIGIFMRLADTLQG
jgi:hypothetical protein